MTKMLRAFALALLLPLLFIGAAFAQDVVVPETVVKFEWGDLLGIFVTNLASNPDSAAWTVFGLVMAWVATMLPAPLQWAWQTFRLEQLLQKSLTAGLNSTAGALAGRTLTADVGNQVIARAVQYAVDNGSKAAIAWAGGPQALHNKLVARLDNVDGAVPLKPQ